MATVLLIEDSAAEVTLVCAALARRRPKVVVLEAPHARDAIQRLKQSPDRVGLVIAGSRALAEAPGELIGTLKSEGIPVVGVAPGLSPAEKQRAIAAGVHEIHDRPAEWLLYSELLNSLLTRFIRADSAPRPGPTS